VSGSPATSCAGCASSPRPSPGSSARSPELVAQLAPQLLSEPGFGPLTAAKLVGEIAGAQRFATAAKLARAAGVAPIPASSGNTRRQRLDQGGNQADVAATAIASAAGAPVKPRVYEPVLRGLLLTGEEPLYLRRDTTGRSRASHQALWWPPVKFPRTYLASYLVSAGRSTEPLVDLDPVEAAAP